MNLKFKDRFSFLKDKDKLSRGTDIETGKTVAINQCDYDNREMNHGWKVDGGDVFYTCPAHTKMVQELRQSRKP